MESTQKRKLLRAASAAAAASTMDWDVPQTISDGELYDAFNGTLKQDARKSGRDRIQGEENDDSFDYSFVLVFPNPRPEKKEDLPKNIRDVSEETAKMHYEHLLRGEEVVEKGILKQKFRHHVETQLYLQAYDNLPYVRQREAKTPVKSKLQRRWSQLTTADEEEIPCGNETYMDLFIRAVSTKLAVHCGLTVKNIVSADGEYLFMLLAADIGDLKREADRSKIRTQLDIEATDPESLLPCDDNFYPLHLIYAAQHDAERDKEIAEAMEKMLKAYRSATPEQQALPHIKYFLDFYAARVGDSAEKHSRTRRKHRHTQVGQQQTMRESGGDSMEGVRKESAEVDPENPEAHVMTVRPKYQDQRMAELAREAYLLSLNRRAEDVELDSFDCIQQINAELNKQHLWLAGRPVLKNLWMRMGFKQPMAAYCAFEGAVPDHCWRPWVVKKPDGSEIESPFPPSQRIKLLKMIIDRQLDMANMMAEGLLHTAFPLDTDEKHIDQNLVNCFSLSIHRVGDLENKRRRRRLKTQTQKDAFEAKTLQQIQEERDEKYLEKQRNGSQKNCCTRFWGRFFGCIWLVLRWLFAFSKNLRFDAPLDSIRNYWGEKIALYFGFLQHYGKSLLFPGIAGIVVFFIQVFFHPWEGIRQGFDLGFAVLMSGWATLCLETWKRRESALALRWGMRDILTTEPPRPQFKGESRRSPINDADGELFYSSTLRFLKQIISIFSILVLLFASCVCVYYLAKWRSLLSSDFTILKIEYGSTLLIPISQRWKVGAPYFTAALNVIQINLLSTLGIFLAEKFTDWENYRTQTEYNDALVIKVFLVQMVVNFNAYFYVAFFKSRIEGCLVRADGEYWLIGESKYVPAKDKPSCLDELTDQLVVTFMLQVFMNLNEIGTPLFLAKLDEWWKARTVRNKVKKERRKNEQLEKEGKPVSDIESPEAAKVSIEPAEGKAYLEYYVAQQLALPEYGLKNVDGSFYDYAELSVQFGYISLFAVVFPLAPIIVIFLSAVELKVDGFKIFGLVRRPLPYNAEHIGSWYLVLQAISVLSVLTNTSLIAFTFRNFDYMDSVFGDEVKAPSKLVDPTTGTTGSSMNDNQRAWLGVFVVSLSLLLLKILLSTAVPDVPLHVINAERRHETVVERVTKSYHNVPKENITVNDIPTEYDKPKTAMNLRPADVFGTTKGRLRRMYYNMTGLLPPPVQKKSEDRTPKQQ